MVVSVQGQYCGGIGTDAGEFEPYRAHGFYLNIQDPAPCNGTIDEFQYCYYRTNQSGVTAYRFSAAFFRETSPGLYSAVSIVFRARRNENNLGSQSFSCVITSFSSPVEVRAGDVIGACIFEPPSLTTVQLDVVGQNASADRYLMRTTNSGCSNTEVPSSVMDSSLTKMESLELHIHANISECKDIHIIFDLIYFLLAAVPITETSTAPSTTSITMAASSVKTAPTTVPTTEPAATRSPTVMNILAPSAATIKTTSTTAPTAEPATTPTVVNNTTMAAFSVETTPTTAATMETLPVTETNTTVLEENLFSTSSSPVTTDNKSTTLSSGQPDFTSAERIGVITLVLVILLLTVVTAVVIITVVIKKRWKRKQLLVRISREGSAHIQNGIGKIS